MTVEPPVRAPRPRGGGGPRSAVRPFLGGYGRVCADLLRPFGPRERQGGGWLVGGGCLTWLVLGSAVLTWWMVKYFMAMLLVCAMLAGALVIGLVGLVHEGVLRLADLWRR